MEGSASPWTLLDAVARDLAEALDTGRLSRDLRPEARRLLMEAWLALKGRRNAATTRVATVLARRLDALVAAARIAALDTPPPALQPDRLRIADRLLSARRAPLEDRVSALEASVDALARRTRHMVEEAEAAARRSGILPPAPGKTAAGAGRETLELVWGDNET